MVKFVPRGNDGKLGVLQRLRKDIRKKQKNEPMAFSFITISRHAILSEFLAEKGSCLSTSTLLS